MLLATRMTAAGLSFIEARASHRNGTTTIDEVVVATVEDADRVEAWARGEGIIAPTRVATAEEIRQNESRC